MGKLVTPKIQQQSLNDIITHDGMTIQLCDAAMELDSDTFDSLWTGRRFVKLGEAVNLLGNVPSPSG